MYSGKKIFKNKGEMKTVRDEQNLRDFITVRSAVKEQVTDVFQEREKESRTSEIQEG